MPPSANRARNAAGAFGGLFTTRGSASAAASMSFSARLDVGVVGHLHGHGHAGFRDSRRSG